MRNLLAAISSLSLFVSLSTMAHADKVDDYIREQMTKRGIPGLSLAILQNGKIVKAKGYGVLEKGSKTPVTSSTLFQAGSISKLVAAVGALKLVEQGKLSLDEDVNTKLTTWKVPENEFTKEKKVTLRGILSHTAGLTVHGFPGYATDVPRPTLVQILNGEKPANTPAIRVETIPGSRWNYSGGGYTIMQQMILDVTGKAFPEFMQETVLGPLGMKDSTYQQPLPEEKATLTAAGVYSDGSAVKGRWHIYPEMAAAGLWTTPSDLVRFAIGVQKAVAGKPGSVLSQAMTRRMLTVEQAGDGLGAFLESKGSTLRFGHNGRDEGFDASLIAYAETGQGAAIMINANENSDMTGRILKVIAEAYQWPDYPRPGNVKRLPAVSMSAAALAVYAGRYEFSNNNMMTLTVAQGKLIARRGGEYFDELIPTGADTFFSVDFPLQFQFVKNARGEITHFTLKSLSSDPNFRIDRPERPRIGPLIHALTPEADPDPALTAKIESALKAFAQGGAAVEEVAGITPGVRKDFARNPLPEVAGIQAISFIATQDVAGRGLERHENKVSRIRYYKLTTAKAARYILIYLTADGQLTDVDGVED